MISEEEKWLLYVVIEAMLENSIKGEWPHQTCDYCSGTSGGYYDSREFNHIETCPNILFKQLKQISEVSDEDI